MTHTLSQPINADKYESAFAGSDPHTPLVGDTVGILKRNRLGLYPGGIITAIDDGNIVVGMYGRYSYDPYFTDFVTFEMEDFQDWFERKVGRAGVYWFMEDFI